MSLLKFKKNGEWVIAGVGAQGPKGDPGEQGKTPVKGTDYFTEADKTELVAAVMSALPKWTGGSY